MDGRVPGARCLTPCFPSSIPRAPGLLSPAASFRLVSAECVPRGADDTRRAAWSLGAPPRAKTFDSAGAPSRRRDPRFDAPPPPPQTVARPPRRPQSPQARVLRHGASVACSVHPRPRPFLHQRARPSTAGAGDEPGRRARAKAARRAADAQHVPSTSFEASARQRARAAAGRSAASTHTARAARLQSAHAKGARHETYGPRPARHARRPSPCMGSQADGGRGRGCQHQGWALGPNGRPCLAAPAPPTRPRAAGWPRGSAHRAAAVAACSPSPDAPPHSALPSRARPGPRSLPRPATWPVRHRPGLPAARADGGAASGARSSNPPEAAAREAPIRRKRRRFSPPLHPTLPPSLPRAWMAGASAWMAGAERTAGGRAKTAGVRQAPVALHGAAAVRGAAVSLAALRARTPRRARSAQPSPSLQHAPRPHHSPAPPRSSAHRRAHRRGRPTASPRPPDTPARMRVKARPGAATDRRAASSPATPPTHTSCVGTPPPPLAATRRSDAGAPPTKARTPAGPPACRPAPDACGHPPQHHTRSGAHA